jgi:thiamine transporter ThiT
VSVSYFSSTTATTNSVTLKVLPMYLFTIRRGCYNGLAIFDVSFCIQIFHLPKIKELL